MLVKGRHLDVVRMRDFYNMLSVCEVVVVPYVDAVVALTVMLVLLHVCLMREYDGVRMTAMLVWGWMRCGEYRACGWYTWFRYCVLRS